MSMTKLEEVLAVALRAATNVDIPAIIEAAQACIVGGPSQTVQTTPVAHVETPAPETEKPKRGRKPSQESVPPPAAEPETPPAPPVPPTPPVAEPPAAPANTGSGLNITGLFEGSGPGKKVVKAVFLTAVEKATNLAALVAINDICDCGIETGGYSEETSPVLRRRLTRWGMALT